MRKMIQLALVLAGLVAVLLVGSTGTASALPTLTPTEVSYVTLLAEGPRANPAAAVYPANSTYEAVYSLAQNGHVIAAGARRIGVEAEIGTVWRYSTLPYPNARWEVACAVAVFAPDLAGR